MSRCVVASQPSGKAMVSSMFISNALFYGRCMRFEFVRRLLVAVALVNDSPFVTSAVNCRVVPKALRTF